MKNSRIYLRLLSLPILALAYNCAQNDLSHEEDVLVAPNVTISSLSAQTIQAENFDRMSGVKTEATTDTGGGTNVGWIDTGDYLEYDLTVPASGSYKFEFRVASKTNTSKFDFYQGSTKLSNANKASTGGWQNWVTTSKTVNLVAGPSTLKLLATGSGWNINWIKITPVDIDEATLSTNLALGKTAEQSSNYSSTAGLAALAVDGNTNGAWNQNSVTHTTSMSQAWWQVRLGEDYTIGDIVIWNRTDCCSSRLSNFDVFVYNDAGTQVYKTTITSTPNPSVTINTGGVVGSRIRIKLKDANPLSLAEVQVFSNEDITPPPPPTGASVEDILGDFWKITLPFDKDGNASPTNCTQYSCRNNSAADLYGLNEVAANSNFSSYFYEDNGWVIFKAFAGGATTENSQYPRSELRGLNKDGDDDYFSMNDHQELQVTVKVMQVPTNRPEVNMVQIHGPNDEPLRVEFNDGSTGSSDGLHLTINESTTVKNVIAYKMKDELKVWVKVQSGKMWLKLTNLTTGATFDNNGNSYSIDDTTGYWKTGCYLQSSAWYCDVKASESYCSNGGSSDSYWATGAVAVKDLTLIRDGVRFK